MRYMRIAALATLLLFVSGLFAPAARADVSFDFFYSNLSPHGSWLVSAQYGRVWQPAVYSAGWDPYYDGHWVYTDVGWTWVSDYEWGAVPYHYGTWALDPRIGWIWVPGYTWAPAWVVFRTGPDYIGWAPVPPSFSIGVSAGFGEPDRGAFVFVSAGNFVAPRIRSCVVPRDRTTVIINRTTVVDNIRVENNVVVNRGPDVSIVERACHRSIRPERIERVHSVAPGPRFSRSELAVEPRRMRGGLRAAEPVREGTPLPAVRHGHDGRDSHGNGYDQPAVLGNARAPQPAQRERMTVQRGTVRSQRQQESMPTARSHSPRRREARAQETRRHQPPPAPTKKRQRHTKPQPPAPGQQQQSQNPAEHYN